METASTQLKLTGKQRKQDREKSDVKQTLSLSSSVTKVKEYTIPGVFSVYHISLGKSGRLWVSDGDGNLVQTDLQGNQLQKLETNGGSEGYHKVTQDGDLIYTDRYNKVINRITPDNTITEFIEAGDWEPISLHSSHINGDILVGMQTDEEAKVTRYNKAGTEIQNIQKDNKGQELYDLPHYITENINGDVCVSDFTKHAVVVVDKSGQYRFSYTGQGSGFISFGICTDELCHILVCDTNSETVHLLDQDVPPAFTAGQYNKEDVAKLLGIITFPNTKPENRKIKPMESASTQLKPTGKQRKQGREKSDVKHRLSLSSSVTKVRKYTVPGVDYVFHISLGKSGRIWVSDHIGYLVQTELQGNQLQKTKTSGQDEGYHTVTQDGDLIYTDRLNKVINRITPGNTITEFIKTGDWEPYIIHSSHINGDILVGMVTNGEAKVTNYNKIGTEIQNIQRDNKGQDLYSTGPHYITENINGDVCVSDFNKHAVVVVDKSGQHRFSYTGQRSRLDPYGICTDVLGHILVCDNISETVHLLDQDGQFLSLHSHHNKGYIVPVVCVWMMRTISGWDNSPTQ
uniref:Tripartite motif-containing protein 3 n=1 Tax=Magallana gigas TaxID=29159 RepID=K1PKI3_MAGGI